jgi:hypothetical protein
VPTLIELRQETEASNRGELWRVVDGLVTNKGNIYVSVTSSSLQEILAVSDRAGHEGTEKMLHRPRMDFFVPDARAVVREWVRSCLTCQSNKTEQLHPTGLLQPLEVASAVWADIAVDFIEGLAKVGGKSCILTVVDRFSMYTHFLPLGHPYTATSVTRLFFDNIVKLHGTPSSIVSDRDPAFTSRFWRELFDMAGFKLQFSSAFHPQSDGQSEVTNKIIAMYLKCLTGDRSRDWLRWLPWAEFCYNSSFQSSLRTTPFRVVYSCDPPSMRTYSLSEARTLAVDGQLRERDEFLTEIRDLLEQAQLLHKTFYYRKHRPMEFTVGD